MQVGLAHEIFFVLLAALVGGLSVKLLKLQPIIGYILGGVIFGSLFSLRNGQIEKIAEIGAILLLFSSGLELSLRKLSKVAKIAVLGGIAQMIVVSVLLFLLLQVFKLSWQTSLILGFGFSLSSTAVVVKILNDRGEANTLHGEIMIGWLLVQDLAVIPAMILIQANAGGGTGGALASSLLAIAKSLAVVFGTLLIGKSVAPFFIHKIASFNSRELLILSAVTLAIGTAALTSFFGISPILGAFLAGVVISESQENHAIFAETRPLRDLFVALFFVTLGFLANPQYVFANLPLIILLTATIIAVKFLVVFTITFLFGYHGKIALNVGLGLTQVGEFAFVIFSQALLLKMFNEETASIGIATVLLTLIVTPLFFRGTAPIWKLIKRLKFISGKERVPADMAKEYSDHIIVCGYGRVGGWVGKALEAMKIPFVVVEYNHEIVNRLKSRGVEVIYGDPAEKEIIEIAGVRRARAVVLAIPDELAQEEIVAYVQNVNPGAKIISRVHKDEDWEKLKTLKVDKLIQPEFEGAITIVRSILISMGKTKEEINERTKKLRLSHATI
jgi:CPA2 family monovalent cation:H+ antiporter-2